MRALRAIRVVFLALLISAVPAGSFAAVAVSITIAPPVLPVYSQPVCPGEGYLWTPGYWAWGPGGYYWVPGVWVEPPAIGLLWTPGYWGFVGGAYVWHAGYWGPHVGFYGGVHYGYGYDGVGFVGGRWQGGRFAYNTAVTNVNRTVVHNTYVDRTVIRNTTVNRASFNGRGGIDARPTPQQEAAARQRRSGPTSEQTSHRQMASQNRGNFASENRGRPATPAMSRPENRGQFNNARPANQRPNANREQRVQPQQRQLRPQERQVRPQQREARPEQREARPQERNQGNHGGGDHRRDGDRNPR